jgi:uncharacterized protein (TIRG00374 family)
MNIAEKKKKKNRRIIGIILVCITVGFLGYQVFNDPDNFWAIFNESHKELLLVLLGLQFLSFALNALTANLFLRYVGQKIPLKESLEVSVMNELGNHVMPIAGGSVTSYIAYRRLGLPSHAIIFFESTSSVLLFLQYSLFFVFGALAVPRSYLSLIPRLALLVLSLGIGALIALIFFLTRKENVHLLRRFIVKTVKFFSLIFPLETNEEELDKKLEQGGKEIRNNFSLFFSQKNRAVTTFILFSVYFFVDILMLFISFRAFDIYLSIPLISLGLLLSLLLSIITLFPGQPGVTETSLVIIFSAFGVPAHNAVLAALSFRIFSYWIWLPLSMFFAVGHKKRTI